MGVGKGAVQLFLDERQRKPFSGKLLTLGRQDVWLNQETLEQMTRERQIRLVKPAQIKTLNNAVISQVFPNHFDATSLFEYLGFDQVESLDVSDYEGADHLFDMNQPDLPAHLAEAYDVVLDAGTLEHVFHVPNALHNIFRMVKKGGRVIHLCPSSNHIDHGFWMISPTLLWDFYSANQLSIERLCLIRCNGPAATTPWDIFEYSPGCLDPVSAGGLDDSWYAVLCVATKVEGSTGDRVPQQGMYKPHWESKVALKGLNAVAAPDPAKAEQPSPKEGLRELLKRNRLIYACLRPLVELARQLRGTAAPAPAAKTLDLDVVARY